MITYYLEKEATDAFMATVAYDQHFN